jgi:hypothetical protein
MGNAGVANPVPLVKKLVTEGRAHEEVKRILTIHTPEPLNPDLE